MNQLLTLKGMAEAVTVVLGHPVADSDLESLIEADEIQAFGSVGNDPVFHLRQLDHIVKALRGRNTHSRHLQGV